MDQNGWALFDLLVGLLPDVVPGQPQTYITYGNVHNRLGLVLRGITYGNSLQHQGLNSLEEFVQANGAPAISGLIINADNAPRRASMPGKGYFDAYRRSEDDFTWWTAEIADCKTFDWEQFRNAFHP